MPTANSLNTYAKRTIETNFIPKFEEEYSSVIAWLFSDNFQQQLLDNEGVLTLKATLRESNISVDTLPFRCDGKPVPLPELVLYLKYQGFDVDLLKLTSTHLRIQVKF